MRKYIAFYQDAEGRRLGLPCVYQIFLEPWLWEDRTPEEQAQRLLNYWPNDAELACRDWQVVSVREFDPSSWMLMVY